MADYFMNTYHRLPAVFTKGEGVWLYDTEGKAYLDFSSGIAVNCLGYNHPALVRALSEQAAKLIHTCNYYQSDVSLVFAEKLVKACMKAGMQKVFLGNSGAEANEGACKIARKYSLKKYGPGRHTIVTLKGSFHGRTITTLSATGQEKFHRDFGPFTEGFRFIPGGDLEELDRALDRTTTAGFLVEAVQGESGIIPQGEEYIRTAAQLCADRDILLMFDEIQCGLGRTGTFLALEAYGVRADVVTLAKGLAGGVPVGAVLAGEKAAGVLQTGDHGSTFGGNPLAAAAGIAVLDTVSDPAFLEEIVRKGRLLMDTVRAWNHPRVREIRGRGLMAGLDIDRDAWPVLEALIRRAEKAGGPDAAPNAAAPGLLLLSAGERTLRFLPPYTITAGEIDRGLGILKTVLDTL
ncbi:MAG: acetylornithine/succinylornithine family transaminase [Treponema sp.]|jgi:acetylornithine/N-succinyldiaminopimelate aminotransferase|nr:acetylornithine/succinylornithine family transaminase [Treponema sp.]